MKAYVYGFTAESGEFFSIGEYGYDGRTLIALANSADAAQNIFENYIDGEYITDETTVIEAPHADYTDESSYLIIGMDNE